MEEGYKPVAENVFRREASPYLTQEYEVRKVDKFKNIEEMVEFLPSLIEEFGRDDYVNIVERESRENINGTSYHWDVLPQETFHHCVNLTLRKIKPSLVGDGVVKGGACNQKQISIYNTGTITINTDIWHNPIK